MSFQVAVRSLKEQSARFHPSKLAQLDPLRLPRHIAIIPDGNRRWAKMRFSHAEEGHREGADTLMEIVKAAKDLKIQSLTFYSFSTENWNRSPEEVFALMTLFATYLIEQREEMAQNGIKLETIGMVSELPSFLQQAILETKAATHRCDQITLILALNYGSRDELCRAFRLMMDDHDNHLLSKDEINEQTVGRYLDTYRWGDPDLLIRTSGELRISNFLLWQLSYAEIHIAPVFWPDFTSEHLLEAILDFQGRKRRWGGSSYE